MTYRMTRNWESKYLAKIAQYLGDRISAMNTIQLPDMRNIMHNLCEIRPLSSP